MRTTLRFVALGLFLLVPLGAHAQVAVSPISDVTLGAGDTLNINVVASDPEGGSIALAATLPGFATLNDPKSGTGIVVTTITLTPLDADAGTHTGSVTATVDQDSDTEDFQVTVTAADADQPPRVVAPAAVTGVEHSLIEFVVTAGDADGEAVASLTAVGLPAGATFTPNAEFTSGTFSWTPDLKQAGRYDVIFVAANALPDSATTHVTVQQSNLGPVALAPIADVTVAEGATATVAVIATDPDEETIQLTASLPSFATLNAPTQSAGVESLQTTITIAPGAGTAGAYPASVAATSGADTATVSFTITVTGPLEATGTLIGAFNEHKKFICFKVWPVDGSFDLLDVSLSGITLSYGGGSITTVRPTHLAYECEDEANEDCDECAEGDGYRYGDGEPDTCAPSHIMACFSMSDIQALFGDAPLPATLADATIEGSLTGDRTFRATLGGKHVADNGHGDGDKPGDGKGGPPEGKGRLALRIHPNPMNPSADISFTLAQPGRVRIAIYDLAGRLVQTVHDGDLPAGANSVPWNGSTRLGVGAASGVYFVSVETANDRVVQRVTILK